MVQQHVAVAQVGEHLVGVVPVHDAPRLRRWVLQLGMLDHRVQFEDPAHVDRAVAEVHVVGFEREGLQEAFDDVRMRAGVDLEADRLAATALDQFLLDRTHQVGALHLVDVEVAVAGDAERARMHDLEPGEQCPEVGLHDVGGEHVRALAVDLGQPQDARQRARHLHDRHAVGAALRARVGEQHDEVQRLVEQDRERVGRVDRERRQDRVDLLGEPGLDPLQLGWRQLADLAERHAVRRQLRHQQLAPGAVHQRVERVRLAADAAEFVLRLDAVGVVAGQPGVDQLHDPGDADLEELVEVAAGDGQELDALEQRVGLVLGLFEHAPVEPQPRQFAVQVQGRAIECVQRRRDRQAGVRRRRRARGGRRFAGALQARQGLGARRGGFGDGHLGHGGLGARLHAHGRALATGRGRLHRRFIYRPWPWCRCEPGLRNRVK